MVEGEIEEFSQVLDAKWAKVLEVEDGETIRSGGTGVTAIPDALLGCGSDFSGSKIAL